MSPQYSPHTRGRRLAVIAGALAVALVAVVVGTLPAALLAQVTALVHGTSASDLLAHGAVLAYGTTAIAAADVKKLIDDVKSAFESFKTSNDERLAEIEKRGSASADVEANVKKANDAITATQARLDEAVKQLRELETAHARTLPGSAAKLDDAQRRNVAAFKAMAAKQPARQKDLEQIEVTDADIQAYRAYDRAFDTYMRLGENMPADVRNALQVGSDPNGGFAVLPDRTGRIVRFITDESPIRELCSVQVVSTDALEGELDMDEDVQSGWVGETEARPETSTPRGPGDWRIPVMEQYANPRTTQKALDDANRDMGAWLENRVGRRLGRQEQVAFHTGDGVKRPRGFLTYAAGKSTATSAANWARLEVINSGAAGAFGARAGDFNPGDRLIDLVAALHPNYRANARWVLPRLTLAEIRKLKDGQGNYMWQPVFSQGMNGLLLDYAITLDEGMPAIAANALGIAFGDFRQGYQIVDHSTGMRVLRDPFTAKPWIHFYTTKRVGGDVIDFQAIKLFRFSA